MNHSLPSRDSLGDNVALDDRLCPGCKKSAVTEHGGLVVAFGQSFFHVDCFKCAKCGDRVTADTNLLLLSDGSPICANCSYNCNVCHLPILDEAIMTGDDSYHAHCFKCKVCKSRIDELVFAKTSQGIYCMKCHSERMIKIRKHAQKKAEREKAVGGSGLIKSRERDASNNHRENGVSLDVHSSSPGTHRLQSTFNSQPSSSHLSETFGLVQSSVKLPSGPYVSDAFEPSSRPAASMVTSQMKSLLSSSSSSSSQLIPVTVAPPPDSSYIDFGQSPPKSDTYLGHDIVKQSTLPLPHKSIGMDDGRRRSYDDGLPEVPLTAPVVSAGLTVASSRRDKRHSINPGLSVSNSNTVASAPGSSPTLSPRFSSPIRQPSTPPTPVASPLREQSHSQSRPTSHNGSGVSHSSLQSSSSLPYAEAERQESPLHLDEQDQTIVVRPSPPSTVMLDSAPPPKPRARMRPFDVPSSLDLDRSEGRSSPSANSDVTEVVVLRSERSSDHHRQRGSRSDSGRLSPLSLTKSRSTSPAHRADVPQNIESETDTEAESDSAQRFRNRDSEPPTPPRKEDKDAFSEISDADLEMSITPELDNGFDDAESSPVEHMSHSTFIAPALPPIRFSMNTADFSELFNSVGGMPSIKSMDHLAKLSEERYTPPSAATFDTNLTPTNDTTVIPVVEIRSHGENDDAGKRSSFCDDRSIDWGSDASDSSHAPRTPPPSENDLLNGFIDLSRGQNDDTPITLTKPGSTVATIKHDTPDNITLGLREAIADAKGRGTQQFNLDLAFIEAILTTLESQKAEFDQLKKKFDGIKRTSRQYIQGLTVAQTEYDRELKARRDAEAEVTRLRVLLSGQVARLTALSGNARREELRQQLSKELNDNLSGLEYDLSKLKVERDMTLAEVEELSATKSTSVTSAEPPTNLGRSLTKRLETLKSQYKHDLIPLTQARETLTREIAELKAVRDVFLEETTVLNARNEELAQLSAVYSRRMESVPENGIFDALGTSVDKPRTQTQQQHPIVLPPSLSSSTSGSSTIYEDSGVDPRYIRVQKTDTEMPTPSKAKFIKWPGSRAKEASSPPTFPERKMHLEHNFQQLSILRFTRCDHCGDKMWGSQLRCTACHTSIHVRCVGQVSMPCAQHHPAGGRAESPTALQPSMFSRDLIEQVHWDTRDEDRRVPVIVEKCIDAVETRALDYEGIYRKTGGSGQSKAITQLFERGDYMAFDLRDADRFNDISSVTSVLKNYFRSLPVPLLTYHLHDQLISAVHIKDPAIKHNSLSELVNKLPKEHYYTLRMLMLHLNHIRERCESNLMNARNLGVVFGPTLMRSPAPGAEFSDMAGKALLIEWLVENAPFVFHRNH